MVVGVVLSDVVRETVVSGVDVEVIVVFSVVVVVVDTKVVLVEVTFFC